MSQRLQKKYLNNSEYVWRLGRLADCLKRFHIPFQGAELADLFKKEKLPSKASIINVIKTQGMITSKGLTPEFLADSILEELKKGTNQDILLNNISRAGEALHIKSAKTGTFCASWIPAHKV